MSLSAGNNLNCCFDATAFWIFNFTTVLLCHITYEHSDWVTASPGAPTFHRPPLMPLALCGCRCLKYALTVGDVYSNAPLQPSNVTERLPVSCKACG
jgi:hypothetical protein